MSEISDNFLSAFNTVLGIDGELEDFIFSDGNGGTLEKTVTVLWIKEESVLFHLHTHGLNRTLRVDERWFMMLATDVPSNAQLYTNDFLDINGVKYKIQSSRIKDGIWNVVASILNG